MRYLCTVRLDEELTAYDLAGAVGQWFEIMRDPQRRNAVSLGKGILSDFEEHDGWGHLTVDTRDARVGEEWGDPGEDVPVGILYQRENMGIRIREISREWAQPEPAFPDVSRREAERGERSRIADLAYRTGTVAQYLTGAGLIIDHVNAHHGLIDVIGPDGVTFRVQVPHTVTADKVVFDNGEAAR